MKAIRLTVTASCILLLATSCNKKKDWWCMCENDTFNSSDEFFLESMDKKMAKDQCAAYNEQYVGSAGIVSNRVCTLK